VCVPTENKIDEDKEHVYEDSQTVVDKVLKSDVEILLCDINAKLGERTSIK
jgi:hypothetical protein